MLEPVGADTRSPGMHRAGGWTAGGVRAWGVRRTPCPCITGAARSGPRAGEQCGAVGSRRAPLCCNPCTERCNAAHNGTRQVSDSNTTFAWNLNNKTTKYSQNELEQTSNEKFAFARIRLSYIASRGEVRGERSSNRLFCLSRLSCSIRARIPVTGRLERGAETNPCGSTATT